MSNVIIGATRIVIHLPYPVSVNHIWKHGKGTSFLSRQYSAWKKTAGQEWLLQKKNQPKAISGPYGAILIAVKPDRRRRDLDNLTKVCKDFAVQHGLVPDDSLCEKLYVRWGTPKEAPLGAKLILRALQ